MIFIIMMIMTNEMTMMIIMIMTNMTNRMTMMIIFLTRVTSNCDLLHKKVFFLGSLSL